MAYFIRGIQDRGYIAPDAFHTNGEIVCQPDELLSWSQNSVIEGQSFLRGQPSYKYIQEGLDLVNGDSGEQANKHLSNVRTDTTVRNLKEIVSAQTNIRIVPAFRTEVNEFNEQKAILNKAFMGWQSMTFFDRQLRKAWQYACVAGTGYLGIRYDPNYYYKGKGDIVVDPYGPLDVLPVGMGKHNDIQKAYSVVLKVATPLHEAWRLFPEYADKIRATRENTKGRGTVISQAVKFASAVLRKFSPTVSKDDNYAPWGMVNVYYIYIDDDSVNNTGRPILMGEPGTSWSYMVPYIGQELKIGETQGGQAIIRKANRQDCLLYPNRRLIKATDDVIVNPDPTLQASPYWHAKVPLVQLRADDWPWMFLGMPITRYGQSLENSNNGIMRGMEDAMNARLSPPRAFDRNTASQSLMETMDTRIPNQVVGLDLSLSPNQIRPLLDASYYEFPAFFPAVVAENEQRIAHQMGVADAMALARARQLPSGDSLDKIMETLGPVIKDQSRSMEEPIRYFGEMWKSNFFQFITASRRLQLLGPEGLPEEEWEYDPGTLIPPAEKYIQMVGYRGLDKEVTYFERARWHKDNFTFSVTPYSLHELNSMTRKLFTMNLAKSGFPLDWWTQAEMFDVKNFGPLPIFTDPVTGEDRTADTIIERWLCQMEMMAHMQSAMAAATQQGQPGVGAAGGAASAGGLLPGQGHKGPGRPGSGQQPPTMEVKSGSYGTRSTIRESKK